MGTGIMICGLNGCGKSTLGRALANELGFHFIDNEDLYFSRLSDNDPYVQPKSRNQVIKLLMDEVRRHTDFVFAAVKGDYGEEILPLYDYVILIEVPREIRLQRVYDRSYKKFGDRMLYGGDLYAQENNFISLVESRPEDFVDQWARSVDAPIIKVDGTKPIDEIVAYIIEQIHY